MALQALAQHQVPVPTPAVPVGGLASIKVKEPWEFNGMVKEVQPFLNELLVAIHLYSHAFLTDFDKACYMKSYSKVPGVLWDWFNTLE
jgi:hypothetical protein